jgi:hypothetical protein
LEERNLMRKRIARILVEGISTVEFFFEREPKTDEWRSRRDKRK